MGVALTKDSIDLGIVVSDPDAALAFYRDLLGFESVGEMKIPGGTMYRLMCGTSLIKLVHLDTPPPAKAAPGGIPGGFGYRYWTMSVSNIEELTSNREIRPGVHFAIVEDPEGNWVEFLQLD